MLRRTIPVLFAALAGVPGVVSAQYFGRNKVQYTDFDFKIIQTEHFDVYYYDRERTAALDAARIAERSYARLSKVLNHEFRERKPIILYASQSDFQQTNATDVGGEGTGGVTDFARNRAVMPFTGAYSDFEHVITHEMTHQFQLDVFSSGRGGSALQGVLQIQPPLWFMEGMAEYMSLGPVNPETAMWLRDAALENKLPTIEQLTYDPRIFPYRFGHALWAYIGERWGDEAIGDILRGSTQGGIEAAFKRVTGLTLAQLSTQWRDAVQAKYLPEVGSRVRARAVSQELLTEKRDKGTLHLAPALSPDGSQVVYFGERDWYFVDLWLADGKTGEPKRRILKSTQSSNYETYRFINSQANWSPDGRYLAFAAKRGPRDNIVIVDVARNSEVKSMVIKLNGVTTPSWSPDGQRLVFTGYDGGLSDLFIVNRDGTGFKRLTEDKYADLHPVWSPDGTTIAFATDRGPQADFRTLKYSNLRIALYHLETGTIEVLPHMDQGKNVSPQWAPDGRSIAFVSDRNGVSNIFLYDFDAKDVYQLTDFYTGAQGITPLSPVLSWSQGADRLAFNYYENGKYDIYALDNPRALKRAPYTPTNIATPAIAQVQPVRDTGIARIDKSPLVGEGGSIYRSSKGFRPSADLGRASDTSKFVPPLTVARMLDSANFALPDTAEFSIKPYKVGFSADYIARPSVGYVRDNFGQGFYGGSAITLSDMLGNHNLAFGLAVNGRIDEAQAIAAYTNLTHRLNWTVGLSQDPYFYFNAAGYAVDPNTGEPLYIQQIRRLVFRSAFVAAQYPFSRFSRVELGLQATNVDDAVYEIIEPLVSEPSIQKIGLGSHNYLQPRLALVHDNSLAGYTGPFAGRRSRFEVSQTIGGWRFFQGLADYRRYDKIAGPVVLATRGLFLGRFGRDANQFQNFIGIPDFLRGHTSGSYDRNECAVLQATPANSQTGCVELDRLIGSRFAVGSAELRFPILTRQIFRKLPSAVPPIEGAFFYDVGIAWNDGNTLKWSLSPTDDAENTRTPLQAYGASIRTNLFGFVILRVDYARPLNRPIKSLWTLSLGPTF